MQVIVTRPPLSAERTAGRLVELGYTPVLMPLFEPRHCPQAVRAALEENPGELILTSAEAVRSLPGGESFDRGWLSRPVHAVGQATARAARAFGFSDIRVSGGQEKPLQPKSSHSGTGLHHRFFISRASRAVRASKG